jgi:hypothetical protein
MAWYARVSHRKILPPEDGSPPRSSNREQLMEEEHARFRDVVRVADGVLAMSDELSRE